MGIIKVEHLPSEFIIIHKKPLHDPLLSWKAKGILTYLIGHDVNWETNIDDLVAHSTDGRAAVRSGLKELQEQGYAKMTPIRNQHGQYVDWDWDICEKPIYKLVEPECENRKMVEPECENRKMVEPECENRKMVENEFIPKMPTIESSYPECGFPQVGNRTQQIKKETKKDQGTKKYEERTPENYAHCDDSSSSFSQSSFSGSEKEGKEKKEAFEEGLLKEFSACWGCSVEWIKTQMQKYPASIPNLEIFGMLMTYASTKEPSDQDRRRGYAVGCLNNGWTPPIVNDSDQNSDIDSIFVDRADWSEILRCLETRVNRASFNTWLRHLHGECTADTLRLLVPDETALYWIREKYSDLIQYIAQEVLGRHVELSLEIYPLSNLEI